MPPPNNSKPSTKKQVGEKRKRGKRVCVKRACFHCRKAKVGCNETRPCPRCTKKGLECFDEHPGEKRRRTESMQEASFSEPFIQPPQQQSSIYTSTASMAQPQIDFDDSIFLDRLLEGASTGDFSPLTGPTKSASMLFASHSTETSAFYNTESGALEVEDFLQDEFVFSDTSKPTAAAPSGAKSTLHTVSTQEVQLLNAKIAQQQSFFQYQQQIITSLTEAVQKQNVLLQQLQSSAQNNKKEPTSNSSAVCIPNPFTSHFHTNTPVAMFSFSTLTRTLLCCNQAFCDLVGRPMAEMQIPRPVSQFDFLIKQVEFKSLQVKFPIPQKGIHHGSILRENSLCYMKVEGPLNFWDNGFTLDGIHYPATTTKLTPERADLMGMFERILQITNRSELFPQTFDVFPHNCGNLTSPVLEALMKPIICQQQQGVACHEQEQESG